jgi:hypothetical protein
MKVELNVDMVKDFALDVWEDLRLTRLSGVALGLAVALFLIVVAILLRPGGEAADVAAAGSPIIAPAPPEEDVSFSAPSEEPMELADIDLSAPRDPFLSLEGAAASDQTLLPAGEEIIDSVMSSGSTVGSTSTGVSTDGASSLMPLDDLSSTTTDTTTSVDDDEDDANFGGVTHDPADTDAPATDYSYVADVQFGQLDDLHRYATVQRLGFIPSRQEPLIMYLGVRADRETAVFMVDSRLSQGGEGTCVPKDTLCTFLELSLSPAHDEHHFMDADGTEYLLRLRGLTRTTASAGSLSGQSVSALRGTPPVVDGER